MMMCRQATTSLSNKSSAANYGGTTKQAGDDEMKIFRVTGVSKKTGCFEAANVMAGDHEQAMKLMAMSHVRVVCSNKRGVQCV